MTIFYKEYIPGMDIEPPCVMFSRMRRYANPGDILIVEQPGCIVGHQVGYNGVLRQLSEEYLRKLLYPSDEDDEAGMPRKRRS